MRRLHSPKFRVILRKLALLLYPLSRVVAGCFWHFERVFDTQNGTFVRLHLTDNGTVVVDRATRPVHRFCSSAVTSVIYFFFNWTVVVVPRADTE